MIPDIVFNRALLIGPRGRGRGSTANKIIFSRESFTLSWETDRTEQPSSLQTALDDWGGKKPSVVPIHLVAEEEEEEVEERSLHCDVVFMSHCVVVLACWVGTPVLHCRADQTL